MKTITALLSLVLTAAFPLTATAQVVDGTWQVETVSNVEPPEGATLTLNFRDGSEATITYTLAGETQSWKYTYAVSDGQLTLEPAKPYGEPQTVTYDIKLEEGKLLLLTPKPDPIEEENEESETEGDAEGEAESDTETATEDAADEDAEAEDDEIAEEEAEDEAEEEDTRVPVWVLTKG
jgi:hypothetical protein